MRKLLALIMVVAMLATAVAGCGPTPTPTAAPTAVPTKAPVPPTSVPVLPTTPTAILPSPTSGDESEVRSVVERFGRKLRMVSLQSPNPREDIRVQYSEFVSAELLQRWIYDPSLAPGRIVSSPWPDRIEIASITEKEPGQYIANGFVVEVTSVEMVSGGAARKVPVQITLQNMQGRWAITEYIHQ